MTSGVTVVASAVQRLRPSKTGDWLRLHINASHLGHACRKATVGDYTAVIRISIVLVRQLVQFGWVSI